MAPWLVRTSLFNSSRAFRRYYRLIWAVHKVCHANVDPSPCHALSCSGVERRGRAAPGNTTSRGDTKKKILVNFVGKIVKITKILWVNLLKKLSGKLFVI